MAPPRSHHSASNSPERTGRRSEDSRDEEHRTGELMGEWLSGLPPTMPFHRGQVLIIPQSPYQQKLGASKSPRKGATTPRLGSKARTDMVQLETDDDNDHTRRDATLGGRRDESTSKKAGAGGGEGAAEDEQGGAEKPEKERLVYVSPGEKKLRVECSELHDVLQHSQARIVAEKTRRHRFLDGNRMSRGDLLQAKHWAFKERKKKAEAKHAAALDTVNTPQSTGSYDRMHMASAGGGDPYADATPASMDVGLDSYAKTPAMANGTGKPMTPKPPSGPRTTPRGGRPASTGTGAEESSPYHARLRIPEDASQRKGTRGASAEGLSTPRSVLRKPGTAGDKSARATWVHGDATQLNQPETERLDTGYKTEAVDWSEPGDGRISLENFEHYPGKRVNSPHSVLAMKRFGVVQEDLERKPDSFYRATTVASLRGPTSPSGKQVQTPEDQSRLAQMRFDFDERSRKRLLDKLMTERERHIKAYAVIITENPVGEGVPAELKAFGHAARNSYLEGPAANGRRKPVRGVMTYVDEMASALIEKGRQKVQRMQMMERKRMQAMVKQHIQSKDRIEELQEKIGDKSGNKAKLIQQMQERLAAKREEKARRSSERHGNIVGKGHYNTEEHMRSLNEKYDRAQQNHEDATNRVRQRLQQTSLIQAMKHERHQQRVLQAARAADYARMCSEEKLERAQHNYEVLAEKREMVSSERAALMYTLHMERNYIGALVEGFDSTGEFKRPVNALAPDVSEILGEIIQLDSDTLEVCNQDRNDKAQELKRNEWVKGAVKKGQYSYFKFKHKCTKGRVCIQLKTTGGDPDIYVGNHQVPFPTKENHIWNVAEFGDDKCTIHPFDKGYVVGWLYVGVYGFSDSEFSINVRWKNRGEGNGPSSSSRQQTGLSAENSYDSIFSQDSGKTPAVRGHDLPKVSEEASEDNQQQEPGMVSVHSLNWVGVAQWLRSLDVEEKVVELVEKERVPGGQLTHMTLEDLVADLGMSKLQAKRVILNMGGRVSSSFSKPSLSSIGQGGEKGHAEPAVQECSKDEAANAEDGGADPGASVDSVVWDPLTAEGGAGGLGDVDNVQP